LTEWKPFWQPKSDVSARCVMRPDLDPELPVGCCEFVGELSDFPRSISRYCVNGTFCPARVYAVPQAFVGCPTRQEKLKSKEGP
jgi:hypothetical protein